MSVLYLKVILYTNSENFHFILKQINQLFGGVRYNSEVFVSVVSLSLDHTSSKHKMTTKDNNIGCAYFVVQ